MPNVYSSGTYIKRIDHDSQGGSAVDQTRGSKSSNAASVSVSASVSATVPTKTGYTFNGWNSKADGSGTNYAAGDSISHTFTRKATWDHTDTINKIEYDYYTVSNQSHTTTIYAKWTALTYTVSYNANGGSGAPAAQTKTYGVNLTLSSTKPTRTGYNFLGWSTSSTATSATYSAGGTYAANAAAVLYAVWSAITYTVSYNKGSNGTGTNSTATKTYNVTLALKGAQFTRTGYTQTGWAISDGGAQAYALSANYTANASVTLYPVWTLNTYQVSYNANGGTGAPGAQTKSYGVTLTLSSTKPTRASASAGSYTVSYNGNGASNPTASTANRTTSYAFKNWNTAANGSGTTYASGGSYTANAAATLYAQWTHTTTTASVTLPTITRTGYRFDGWFTAQTGGTQVTSPYTPGGNVTLYAHWTATASTVSAPNGTIGSSLAITITRGSTNSYTHDLSYSFGSLSNQSIATGVGTSYSWSIPSTLALQYPNTTSASCTITCVTKNGSTVIGTTTTTITLSIPYKPTISSFTASPVSANSAVSGWGIYLKGYSRVKLDVVAEAGYGASIINVEFSGPGISQTNSTSMTAQSPILSYANATLNYTVTVKDSRQQTTTVELSVASRPYFYDYAPPVVTGIAVARCDSSGNLNNSSGGFLSATPSFTFSSIGSRNSISSSVLSYGLHGSGSAIASKSPVTSGTTYKTPSTSWAVAAVNAYDVALTIADAVLAADSQTIPYTTTLPSVQGIWYGKGNDRLGLGGVPTGPGLHVDWDATFNGVVDVTPRRCEATLPTSGNGAGWYRAIVYNSYNANSAQGSSGEIVTIKIVYTSMVSVQHEISLFMTVGKIAFLNETSHGTTNLVDQIRYLYNGSTGYIDIHWTTATPCYVNVSFDVASRNYAQELWVAGALTSVADSPSGETELARYTFHAKAPMSDVSSLITWNTTNYIADSSGMKVYLDGGKLIFTGQLRLKTGISFQGIDLGTLDSSIAAVTNSFFMAAYASDVTAIAVAHPITIYMSNSTTIRAANEGPNNSYAVGSPTANNYIRFNSVIPLA